MLLYLLLDTSQSLIYWIIKNLGFGAYYSIRYLFYGPIEDENKKTLELLIEQKEDIENIKEFIEKIKNEKKTNIEKK
jgi:hypothetical protein|uniref:Uncharacterized protein n=1 Tax=Mimiviridae sp. ChoanoV1 TaxID=2596887 RepID=A0A5B8IGP5_9VIRU|nr:hypothetical protein 7_4 [Mimiviridae sp. ChoanoV1]